MRRKQKIYNLLLVAGLALLVGIASACVTKAVFNYRAAKEEQNKQLGGIDSSQLEENHNGVSEIVEKRGPEDVDITDLPVNAPRELAIAEISNVSASRELVLSWNKCAGAAAYQVARMDNATGAYEKLAVVDGEETSYADKGCVGGEIYSYQIFALDGNYYVTDYSAQASQLAIDGEQKMIALTYDDGPSNNTPVVLDAVEKYKAHVTFFVVGERLGSYKEHLKRAAGLGCEIGNHTYEHSWLTKLDEAGITSQISKTNDEVREIAGVDIRLLRPPGGLVNDTVKSTAGMPLILWSIDTLDWKTKDTDSTIQCVKDQYYDGAIVLMHDLYQPTANAADEVMRYLKEEGYQLVTVSEMAAYRGGMDNGVSYYQFKRLAPVMEETQNSED